MDFFHMAAYILSMFLKDGPLTYTEMSFLVLFFVMFTLVWGPVVHLSGTVGDRHHWRNVSGRSPKHL